MAAAVLASLTPCGGALAQSGGGQEKRVAVTQMTVALFSGLQELGPLTDEQMAERHKDDGDPDGAAADLALNRWKRCVIDAVARWAELRQGPGTLAEGAFGRCADVESEYRGHLSRIKQDGRTVIDLQLARAMMRGLREAWQPRLIAAALDQELAMRAAERLRPDPPTRAGKGLAP